MNNITITLKIFLYTSHEGVLNEMRLFLTFYPSLWCAVSHAQEVFQNFSRIDFTKIEIFCGFSQDVRDPDYCTLSDCSGGKWIK